ncbi:hypothetical protein J437_LFUL003771 [Ladona fulva]|uniref:SPX domain-containing protein n=1 Tax=Ladona fulva TaxID=123851 RepID=A0A8K0NWT3_LADFU|nr:hypothetical protein J437_LFUL003771 [Ladona fulva]
MKNLLYEALEESPSPEVVDPAEVARFFKYFDENFFQYSENELTKINNFFSEKEAEATRKMVSLQNKLKETLEPLTTKRTLYVNKREVIRKKDIPSGKKRELKLAFSEFYLSLILLQKYQDLNAKGFQKIMKKHDKVDTSQCMEKAYVARSVVASFPAWLRFAQCCRRFRDTKEAFPHLLNAAKYSTVFFVFGSLALHKAYEDSSDQAIIVKMMDEEDGALVCRKRKNNKKKEEKVTEESSRKLEKENTHKMTKGKQIIPEKLMEK